MKVAAYCAVDWRAASAHAAGTTPWTSPSHDGRSIERLLPKAAAADIFYLNLHGFPDQPNLFGQAGGIIGPTALTPQLVSGQDWSNVLIFAEVCYSAAAGGSAIAKAFLDAGALAFIGSVGAAYGRARPTLLDGEADRLFWLFRHVYRHVHDPARALARAKRLLTAASFPLDAEDKATLSAFICLRSINHEFENEPHPVH